MTDQPPFKSGLEELVGREGMERVLDPVRRQEQAIVATVRAMVERAPKRRGTNVHSCQIPWSTIELLRALLLDLDGQ